MINDKAVTWTGKVSEFLEEGGEKKLLDCREVSIESLGGSVHKLALTTPPVEGNYKLIASFIDQSNRINSVCMNLR